MKNSTLGLTFLLLPYPILWVTLKGEWGGWQDLRTLGMAAWPLNRLRTLLSIPFGFLQLSLTLL